MPTLPNSGYRKRKKAIGGHGRREVHSTGDSDLEESGGIEDLTQSEHLRRLQREDDALEAVIVLGGSEALRVKSCTEDA